MKRRLLMVLAVFVAAITAHSQDNCDHNVSTNYKNPTNSALPTNTGFMTEFLNSFDWNVTDNHNVPAPYQLQNMFYNQLMTNISDPQQDGYYSYIFGGEKMSYENGWELLLLNIGRYPNNTPVVNAQFIDIPYIVLYNRYKGIIRLFANFGVGKISDDVTINAMRIELSFFNNFKGQYVANGLLRLNNGRDQALDQKTVNENTSSLVKHPNQPGNWFSADFQVAYDPCICYYPSNLKLRFFVIQQTDLELHGREISVEQDLINGKAINSKDFLSNFDYTGESADGGMLMYHALDYLVNDYQQKLEKYEADLAAADKHNTQVRRNLAMIKAFKSIILGGGDITIAAISQMEWFGDFSQYAGDLLLNDALNTNLLVDEVKKALGSEVNVFISENFTEQPLPNKPITPTATFSEMHFKGQLSTITPLNGPSFFTPGTYGSIGMGSPGIQSYFSYPIYNDPLGVFALLETPKFILSKTTSLQNFQQTEPSLNWTAMNTTQLGGKQNMAYLYKTWSTNYQFQLAEPLKYAFNNTLDIKSTKVSASISFQPLLTCDKTAGQLLMGYIEPANSANILSIEALSDKNELDPNAHSSLYTVNEFSNGSFYVGKSSSELEVYKWATNYVNTRVAFNSPFLALDEIRGHTFSCGFRDEAIIEGLAIDGVPEFPVNLENTGLGIDANRFVLTLVIDVEFNTLDVNGKNNATTLILKYYVEDGKFIKVVTSDLVPNLSTSNNNLTRFPENLLLKDIDFNGAPVKGCSLNNKVYTCQAWRDITINGYLKSSNGYSAELVAGNQIEASGESVVSPEVSSSIMPLLNYSNPMPEATPTYIASFCKNKAPNTTGYQANVVKNAPEDVDPSEPMDESAERFDFNLFPNPSSNVTTVAISGADAVYASIQVFDVMGKEQALAIEQEGGVFRFNVSTLDKGIYFVKVSSANGAKTKQLLVK